jgi:ABC transporter substrate binding protein
LYHRQAHRVLPQFSFFSGQPLERAPRDPDHATVLADLDPELPGLPLDAPAGVPRSTAVGKPRASRYPPMQSTKNTHIGEGPVRSPSGRVRDHHRCRDHRIRRRWFIASLGAAALTLPRFATAQLPIARLAFLVNQLPHKNPPYWGSFVEVLRERGWDEGRNIIFHLRAAEGNEERYQQLAAELVGLRPAVIIAANSQATQAARQLTNTIPIVMIGPSDPLGAGFIASFARPGGNITGLTNQLGDSAEKQLQTLKELRPGLSRIALLWNPDDAGSRLAAKAQLAHANPLAPRTRFPPIFSPTKPREMRFGKLPARSGPIARAPAFAAALLPLR